MNIEQSVQHFRALLESQIERAERIKNSAPAKRYDGQRRVTIGLIPGDGVAAEALRAMGILIYDEGHIDELIERLDGECR